LLLPLFLTSQLLSQLFEDLALPASLSEGAQFQTSRLQITSILAETQVFIDPSLESHTGPTFSGCLFCFFVIVVDSKDVRHQFYLRGRQA